MADKSHSGPSGSAVVELHGIELESPHPKPKKPSAYYIDPSELKNEKAQEAERQRMEIVTSIQNCWTAFMSLTLLAIVAFVLEQELTTSHVFCKNRLEKEPCDFTIVANSSYDIFGALVFFQIVFTLCTVLSSLAIVRVYYLQHLSDTTTSTIGTMTPASSSFFGDLGAINPLFLRCLIEAGMVLLHIPPGVFQTFTMIDMFDTTITYSVRVINIIVFFRFAFLAYFINSRSPFQRSTGHIATVLYGRPNPLTPLKKIIADDPVTVLFAAFIATLSIFAYFVTVFERPGVNRTSYPSTILEYKHIYNQAWWYAPQSFHQCKFVTCCTGTFGPP